MDFSIDKQDKHTVIKINESKLNSLVAPELKSEIVVLNTEGVKNIILDLTDVTFIDSSGLSSVLIGNRMCKNVGGTFILTQIQDNVAKLLQISQLDNILRIIPTVQEAVDLILLEEVERNFNDEE